MKEVTSVDQAYQLLIQDPQLRQQLEAGEGADDLDKATLDLLQKALYNLERDAVFRDVISSDLL